MKTLLFIKTPILTFLVSVAILALFADTPNVEPNETFFGNSEDAPIAIRINSGGPQITYNGEVFEKDRAYGGDSKSFKNSQIADIKKTDRDELYRTERSTLSGKNSFTYAISLPNGSYTIKLHFAEIYWGATGGEAAGPADRVFDVTIENQKKLTNFNIYDEAGSMTALVKTFTVTVTDGTMNLGFKSSKDQPKLAALEILGEDDQQDNGGADEAIYINAGGNQLVSNGKTFLEDRFYKGGRKFSNTKIGDIKNTTADALYKTERSTGKNLGTFAYEIPVSAGIYEVKLHFAEIYWGATGGGSGGSGKRVFDLVLENNRVLDNYDLNKEVGSMTAVVKTYTANVSDGILNLDFSASVNEPKISAIEVVKLKQSNDDGDAVARINCGGSSITYNNVVYAADDYYDANANSFKSPYSWDIKNTTEGRHI